MSDDSKRLDGTAKGLGFFGVLQRPDGDSSTELSIGVNLNGKEMQIPLIVPTLSREEIDGLLKGQEPSEEIAEKAVQHAIGRMKSGKPLFAADGEQHPLPASAEEQFRQGFEGAIK